jgi:chemotaxis regulatin CheY-phosphate phosphatase CheZ
MNTERYYTIMLEGARKRHSALIRDARPFSGCIREDIKRQQREWQAFARRAIKFIKDARNGH